MNKNRPIGIVISAFVLHALNLLTVIFIEWNEPDSLVLAALIGLYICFTALVIHAYWLGQPWARWMILPRSVYMLASYKLVLWEGGLHRAQGIAERTLALVLLVYL